MEVGQEFQRVGGWLSGLSYPTKRRNSGVPFSRLLLVKERTQSSTILLLVLSQLHSYLVSKPL